MLSKSSTKLPNGTLSVSGKTRVLHFTLLHPHILREVRSQETFHFRALLFYGKINLRFCF
jgi:hypothetical protein